MPFRHSHLTGHRR